MQSSSGLHPMTSVLESSGGNNTINSHHRHHHHRHLQSQVSVANSQARLEQLFDEQDHKRCSEGNRKALLAENLDQLRGLSKVIEADDWKYHSSSASKNNGGAGSASSTLRIQSTSGDGSNNI